MNSISEPRRGRGTSLIFAGLLLGVALALYALAPRYLSHELAQRVFGVLMGIVVVLYSNGAPKAVPRRLEGRCGSAEYQDLRRFGGWTLVLGGVGYALAWVVAPIAMANWVSAAMLATALVLVLGRLAWVLTRRNASNGEARE